MVKIGKIFKFLKGKRKGQTKISKRRRIIVVGRKRVTLPPGYYIKGGRLYKYSYARDYDRVAKRKRKRTQAPWRGDVTGGRV